jgi:predicted nucleic acid-binding protein
MIIYALDTNIVSYFLKNDNTIQNKFSEKGIDKIVLDIASRVKLKLRQQGKGISDDDLFIAAYCLKHNLPSGKRR